MFILTKDFDEKNPRDYPLFQLRCRQYYDYLESVKEKIPISAREFAFADWRINTEDQKCPHDSWVEHIKIFETSSGKRNQYRFSQIEIKLLGAYHDGSLFLNYKNVKRYSLNNNSESHGDWLYDEIRLSENGLVLHEIEFANDTIWKIECEDIKFEWIQFEDETAS